MGNWNGVKLTTHPVPQCLANPFRGVIIAPFQEPLDPHAEHGCANRLRRDQYAASEHQTQHRSPIQCPPA